MSAALRILYAGPGCTLQDAGRFGYLRFGITSAGPMDRLAYDTANAAAGAARGATAIEISAAGLEAAAEGGAICAALAGGAFHITLDGRELPHAVRVRLEPGARLSIRPGASGAWCYLAVAGGFDVPAVLGSTSTHLRSGMGGLEGRMLAAGDSLSVPEARDLEPAMAEIAAPWLDRPGEVIRVIRGPQDDYFDSDQFARFLEGPWTVSARCDRMAYLLDGPAIEHAKGFNIVSDGVAVGAVQVLGDGRPLVFMADRPPTGGYPKIATVIGCDVGRLAQLLPGARFRFAAVSIAEAVEARRAEAAALAGPIELHPLPRLALNSELLLTVNLIGGVTDGSA
jgi:biotin-dependent carboxylase-like uncharacterized protein